MTAQPGAPERAPRLVRPHLVEVPDDQLEDLHRRLAATRFADEIGGSGSSYGVSTARVRHLVERWQHGFDWRVWEHRLRRYPQYVANIDGERIHFLHVRSGDDGALPIILTHGWPGTVFEYLAVLDDLAEDFDLVIPSMPGFAFSGPTRDRGWSRYRISRAWSELMRGLGYERYGAAGNDAGANVSVELGRIDPDHVVGVHVTQVYSFPSGDPAEFEGLGPEDQAALARLQWFWETMGAFSQIQSQSPQTLAHALVDSPAGLLGWMAQLLGDDLDDDFVLANVSAHWLFGTAGSSMRLYYEDAKAVAPAGPTTTPLGLAAFANDFQSIRRFAERDHARITQWHVHDVGGHYAAHQAPEVFASDLRGFFQPLE